MEDSYDNLPPLPDALAWEAPDEESRVQAELPSGCYYLRFVTPGNSSAELLGTLRVDHAAAHSTASGDLYFRLTTQPSFPIPASQGAYAAPAPSGGVPIFPRGAYRYYLRVTSMSARRAGGGVRVAFEAWEYDHAAHRWSNRGARSVELAPGATPSGYPSGARSVEGEVRQGGTVRGTMSAGWVSRYLRRGSIEIDRVTAAELPRSSGAGVSFQDVFEHVKWQLSIVESSAGIHEPSGETWSDAELHAAMLTSRERCNLDQEWRYHLLCVRRLASTSRGIMYDAYGTDSNNVPREGAAIASHWTIPNEASWGATRGARFGTSAAPYFRTAVHELSHALGLYHPPASDVGTHVMQTTDVIVTQATSASPFPGNIVWRHSAGDAKRLQHFPDHWVRPGGQAFGGDYGTAPISVDAECGGPLRLELSPLLPAVPLGAPVRVHARLVNCSDQVLRVPASLSLRSGTLRGAVRGPARADKTFRTCVLCMDEEPAMRQLAPGEAIERDETLWRGRDGALFDGPGLHTIRMEAHWTDSGHALRVSGETSVIVTSPVDADHARAAREVLDAPDLLLVLAFGGDHLPEGQAALATALADRTLRPHFAAVEARRLSEPFFARAPMPQEAQALLDESPVLSESERAKLSRLLDAAQGAIAARPDLGLAERAPASRRRTALYDENPMVAL